MKQSEVIAAADLAAGVVGAKTPPATSFARMLGVEGARLAKFLDDNPEIDAEGLYRFACRSSRKHTVKTWADLPAKTRSAFEVYRATYSVLMKYVREAEAAEREKARAASSGRQARTAERIFDERTPGIFDRVKLR